MDLEQLTKHQILLLTLLVSFVTSIATGIVTVSLMDQAPEGVTRVINQIVERTVETVTPATQGAAVATEKTVVIKQDELVPQSIQTVQKSVVRFVEQGSDQLVARGVLVGGGGLAVSDRVAIEATNQRNLEAILASGERVRAEVRRSGGTQQLVFLDVSLGTSTAVAPAVLADTAKLTLGQTVLRISGNGSDTVAEGVIAALPAGGEEVDASVGSATPGSVLLTIFGEVIGITTSSPNGSSDRYTIISLPETPAVTNSSSSS